MSTASFCRCNCEGLPPQPLSRVNTGTSWKVGGRLLAASPGCWTCVLENHLACMVTRGSSYKKRIGSLFLEQAGCRLVGAGAVSKFHCLWSSDACCDVTLCKSKEIFLVKASVCMLSSLRWLLEKDKIRENGAFFTFSTAQRFPVWVLSPAQSEPVFQAQQQDRCFRPVCAYLCYLSHSHSRVLLTETSVIQTCKYNVFPASLKSVYFFIISLPPHFLGGGRFGFWVTPDSALLRHHLQWCSGSLQNR